MPDQTKLSKSLPWKCIVVLNGHRLSTRNSTLSPWLIRSGGPGNWPFVEITGLDTPATVLFDHVKVTGKNTVAADVHWTRHRSQRDRLPRGSFISKDDTRIALCIKFNGLLLISYTFNGIPTLLCGPRASHIALRGHMHLGVFMRVYHIRCMISMGASCLRARIGAKKRNNLFMLLSGTNLTTRGIGGGEIHRSISILVLGLEAYSAANPITQGSSISSYSSI